MAVQQGNQNPPAGRLGGNNNNQNQNNNQQSSRFGGRFGRNNQNQNNNQPPPARAARPSRFGKAPVGNQRKDWTMLPLSKTVVRFDLEGLGDPFYKMLGHELNTEYSHGKAVSQALESGGENVDELETLLDKVWEGYDLQGAMMVYRWNPAVWKGIETPFPMPSNQIPDWLADVDDDDFGEETPKPPPTITYLRALDLPLVLNVLARSRTQVLLTKAPLVFSQQYLNRALVTDDPRIVALTRATGYLQEKL